MASDIAKAMTNFAGDVWKGMSQGVDAGKKFRVKGVQTANNALKGPQRVNRVNKNSIKKAPKISKQKSFNKPTMAQKAGNFVGGGIRDTYKNINEKDMKLVEGLKAAHSAPDGKGGTRLSKTKMAGTFVGASAAGRIATGGGVMKDKNGNTNVIGIPFI